MLSVAERTRSDLVVNKNNPIALRRSASGDGFDLLMKVFDISSKTEHFIFVDNKAVEEDEKTDSKELRQYVSDSDFPDGGKRAKYMDAVLSNAGLSYCYVYQVTHSIAQGVFKHWVVTGREATKGFMGPVWDIYEAIRTSFCTC